MFKDNNIEKVKLSYFGTAPPEYYGIIYEKLLPYEEQKGWIAISATYLQGVHTAKRGYDWLKDYEPIAKIGYTIFLYNLKTSYSTPSIK